MHWKLLSPLFYLALTPSLAFAQTQLPAADGRAAALAPASSAYQSAFADYKPYTEPVVMSWREANDRARDSGGMQGHDMATMKSQSDNSHAGHDMAKMGANPPSPSPGAASPTSAADNGVAGHAQHGAKKAPAADPHAGHDMAKTLPAQTAAPGRARARVSSAAKRTDPGRDALKAAPADPHAGHDMSTMSTPAPQDAAGSTNKANNHEAPPANQPKHKKERQ